TLSVLQLATLLAPYLRCPHSTGMTVFTIVIITNLLQIAMETKYWYPLYYWSYVLSFAAFYLTVLFSDFAHWEWVTYVFGDFHNLRVYMVCICLMASSIATQTKLTEPFMLSEYNSRPQLLAFKPRRPSALPFTEGHTAINSGASQTAISSLGVLLLM